jgi:acetyl esterase/lipase
LCGKNAPPANCGKSFDGGRPMDRMPAMSPLKRPVHPMNIPTRSILFVALLASSLAVLRGAAPQVISDVAYLPADREEKLDVYVPAGRPAAARSPALVWVHGGGWMRGDKAEASAKEICTTLVEAGYVVVSINYKVGAASWPQNVRDVKSAIRFLRAKAMEYGVDPDRIGVGGGSAGAHLALMAAFTAGRPEFDMVPVGAPAQLNEKMSNSVRCVLDLYGPTALAQREAVDAEGKPLGKRRPPANSMEAFGASQSYDGGTVDFFLAASPITYVNRNSPPVLILQGTRDSEVDPNQPKMLAAIMTQHKVPHEILFVEGAGHGFDFESWQKKPLSRDLRPVALAFLAKYLGPAK